MAAAHVWSRIQVSYKAYYRHCLVDIRRKRCHQIAVVVKRNLLQPHFLKFLLEITGKFHLPGGGGCHVSLVIALCVELHIA